MFQFSHVISSGNGLHARNAMQLARLAAGYSCRIQAACNGRKADAKQVFGLLGLAAHHSDTVIFQIEGPEEDEAGASMMALAKEIL